MATASDAQISGRDIIDQLAGITPGSPLARVRAHRPDVARYAQSSYEALLEPEDLAGVSRREREMVALRVAWLTPSPVVAARHRERLRRLGADDAIRAVEQFPNGDALSEREMAILCHTDHLTLEPHAATPTHIVELKAAGLTPRDIVTIAQLISFMTFQVRVVVALRALSEDA
ncbi:MAG: CMD domain protein [Chloroflexota bacterium]|nr:CMD domain protein [Chloroflexota bacterium]